MEDEYELKKHIPDELLFEDILVRLPVKSLLVYKSVCKTWLYTIESRSFIETHRRHHCCEYSDQIVFTTFKSVSCDEFGEVEIQQLGRFDTDSCIFWNTFGISAYSETLERLSPSKHGLDTKIEKSRKQLKERKNRAKKVRGVKKTKAGDAAKKK